MISQGTQTAIQAQMQALRNFGLNARLPNSAELFGLAFEEWKKKPYALNDLWWRRAAICYGVALNASGDFAQAARTYDATPLCMPRGYMRQLDSTSRILAVHMQIGEIVSRMRCGGKIAAGALALTHTARETMALVDPPQILGQYRGVILALSALTLAPRGAAHQVREYATSALAYINPRMQPQLTVLMQKYAGTGDGMMHRVGLRRNQQAKVQPSECLYFFTL